MSKKTFWEETSSSYDEELSEITESYIKYRYFNFIEKLATYTNNKEPYILKTDGWDLLYTPKRNPYDLLTKYSARIVVTDISSHIVSEINSKYPNIESQVCQVQNIGSTFENRIDLLIDLSTIDHVPESDVGETIKSYSKALSSNGYGLIVFWKKSWHFYLLNLLHSLYKRRRSTHYYDEERSERDGQYYFNEHKVITELEEQGLKVIYKKRFGVIMSFLGRFPRLTKAMILWDDILSKFSGGMCAVIVKKI